jgi:hypothetical protein
MNTSDQQEDRRETYNRTDIFRRVKIIHRRFEGQSTKKYAIVNTMEPWRGEEITADERKGDCRVPPASSNPPLHIVRKPLHDIRCGGY